MSAEDVRAHYAGGRFRERLAAGADQLHVRGEEATRELAALARLQPGERVLDLGSGIGGPARMLAREHGVRVVGVDLTPEFVEAAAEATRAAGLAEQVEFVRGDAVALPFPSGTFDVAWTQHATMNVADKPRVYAELRRVVRDGGRLALYDVVAGDGEGEPAYPLPWASRRELSFLVTEVELERLLRAAGFELEERRDLTDAGARWAGAFAQEGGGAAFENLARGLADGTLRLLQAVARADEGLRAE